VPESGGQSRVDNPRLGKLRLGLAGSRRPVDGAQIAFGVQVVQVPGQLLADYQITIPELGTYRAVHPPIVIITSNRTREIHDALKRRCLYHWIDYPDFQKELQIVTSKIPEASRRLAQQVTAFVQELRETELYKVPGVAETLDWTAALVALNQKELDPQVIDDTMGIMLKYQEDIELVRGEPVRAMLERSANRGPRRGRRGGGGG